MSTKLSGKYILKRGNWYHYKRRVPEEYRDLFNGTHIRAPLETDSRSIAVERAKQISLMLEDYYRDIALNGDDQDQERYKKAFKKLKMCGFRHLTFAEVIAETSLAEFTNRINTAEAVQDDDTQEALIGTLKKPDVLISNSLDALIEHEKINLSKKNSNELKKWTKERKLSIGYFVSVVGDKPIETITREDILNFRKWWVNKVLNEDLATNTANKAFTNIKRLIRIASDNNSFGMPVEDMFKDIRLKGSTKAERRPFPPHYVQDVLLKHDYKLKSPECWLLIFAMADTGARIKEIVGLDVENGDIVLDSNIPHIKIRENKYRGLKTLQSRRDIPLVGASLFAFQELAKLNSDVGGGFKRYLGKSELISATVNKYLKTNDLIPAENITLYSIRHSFSDILYKVRTPEKTHRAIFGHTHDREKYGDGITLKEKKYWLDKIASKIEN